MKRRARLKKKYRYVPLVLLGIVLIWLVSPLSVLAPSGDDISFVITKITVANEHGGSYTWTGSAYVKSIPKGKAWSGWYSGDPKVRYTNPNIIVQMGSTNVVQQGEPKELTAANGTKYRVYTWRLYTSIAISAEGFMLDRSGDKDNKPVYTYGAVFWDNWANGVPDKVTVTVELEIRARWSGWLFGKAYLEDVLSETSWYRDDGSDALQVVGGTLEKKVDPRVSVDTAASPVEPREKGGLINVYGKSSTDNPFGAAPINGAKMVFKAIISPGYALWIWYYPGDPGDAQAYGIAHVIFRFSVVVYALEKIEPESVDEGKEMEPPQVAPDDTQIVRAKWYETILGNPWLVGLAIVAVIVVTVVFAWLLGPAVRATSQAVASAANRSKYVGWIVIVLATLFVVALVVVMLSTAVWG